MLDRGRNTPEVADGRTSVLPVKAGVKIFEGSLVALGADGFAIPGAKATGLLAAGRAEEYTDNTGGVDGAVTVRVRRGVFRWSNAAAAGAIKATDLLKTCYIADDETVTITATGASAAGKVIGVDADGVLVETL